MTLHSLHPPCCTWSQSLQPLSVLGPHVAETAPLHVSIATPTPTHTQRGRGTHTHTYIHRHTYTHIHPQAHIHTHRHTYTQAHIHTHTHTQAHIHTHTHRHTYTAHGRTHGIKGAQQDIQKLTATNSVDLWACASASAKHLFST